MALAGISSIAVSSDGTKVAGTSVDYVSGLLRDNITGHLSYQGEAPRVMGRRTPQFLRGAAFSSDGDHFYSVLADSSTTVGTAIVQFAFTDPGEGVASPDGTLGRDVTFVKEWLASDFPDLTDPTGIAVYGNNMYVSAGASRTEENPYPGGWTVVLRIEPDGSLTFLQKSDLPASAPVIVSPDGSSVYSFSAHDEGTWAYTLVKRASRNPATGLLGSSEVLAEMNWPYTAAVISPDGRFVYAGLGHSALSVWSITGSDATVVQEPSGNYTGGLAIAPDGSQLFATTPQDEFKVFDINSSSGKLTLRKTFSPRTDGPEYVESLFGAAGVAVSPDGHSVYVAASHLTLFDRSSAGDLSYDKEYPGSWPTPLYPMSARLSLSGTILKGKVTVGYFGTTSAPGCIPYEILLDKRRSDGSWRFIGYLQPKNDGTFKKDLSTLGAKGKRGRFRVTGRDSKGTADSRLGGDCDTFISNVVRKR